MRTFHAWLTRWLWGRAGLLALALLIGWLTGNFYTGLTVAVILFFGFFVALGLLAGSVEWRVARSFGAERGRVLTTVGVMENGWPILVVMHEEAPSRSWRFLHEEDDLRTELIRVHIQQLLERDPSVAGVAALPAGQRAWRASLEDDWEVAPIERTSDQLSPPQRA